MNYLNRLREALSMYDRDMGDQGNRYVQAPHGGVSQVGAVPVTGGVGNRAQRMLWAERMAGRQDQEQPDFFGDEGGGNVLAQYVRPEMGGAEPMERRNVGPRRVNSVLARLMGASYG